MKTFAASVAVWGALAPRRALPRRAEPAAATGAASRWSCSGSWSARSGCSASREGRRPAADARLTCPCRTGPRARRRSGSRGRGRRAQTSDTRRVRRWRPPKVRTLPMSRGRTKRRPCLPRRVAGALAEGEEGDELLTPALIITVKAAYVPDLTRLAALPCGEDPITDDCQQRSSALVACRRAQLERPRFPIRCPAVR